VAAADALGLSSHVFTEAGDASAEEADAAWLLGLPTLAPLAVALASGLVRLEGLAKARSGREAVLLLLPLLGLASAPGPPLAALGEPGSGEGMAGLVGGEAARPQAEAGLVGLPKATGAGLDAACCSAPAAGAAAGLAAGLPTLRASGEKLKQRCAAAAAVGLAGAAAVAPGGEDMRRALPPAALGADAGGPASGACSDRDSCLLLLALPAPCGGLALAPSLLLLALLALAGLTPAAAERLLDAPSAGCRAALLVAEEGPGALEAGLAGLAAVDGLAGLEGLAGESKLSFMAGEAEPGSRASNRKLSCAMEPSRLLPAAEGMLASAAAAAAGLVLLTLFLACELGRPLRKLEPPILWPSERLGLPNSATEPMARKALMAPLAPGLPSAAVRATLAELPAGPASTVPRPAFLPEPCCCASCAAPSACAAGWRSSSWPASGAAGTASPPLPLRSSLAALLLLPPLLLSEGVKALREPAAKGEPSEVSGSALPAAASSESSLRLMALMLIFCSLTAPGLTMLPEAEPLRPTGAGVSRLSSSGDSGGWGGLGDAGEAAAAGLRVGAARVPAGEAPGSAAGLAAEALLLGVSPAGLRLGASGDRVLLESLADVSRGDLALALAGLPPEASGSGVLLPSWGLAGEAGAGLEAAGDLPLLACLAAGAAAGDLLPLLACLGPEGDAAGLGSGVAASLRTAAPPLPGAPLRPGLEAGVESPPAWLGAAAALAGPLLAETLLMRRLSELSVSLRSCSADRAPPEAFAWLPAWLAAGVTSTALILRLSALMEPSRAARGLAVVVLRRRGGVSGPPEGLRAAGEPPAPRCSGRM
jgi:hypothetical protein